MLRRNSSRNKQRRPMGRSKSTTSIPRSPVSPVSRLVSIEPAVAERDAYIAATLSYHAPQRHSYDMPSTPRARPSFAHGSPALTASSDVEQSHRESSTCSVARQQSIRFAGPNARPRRALAPRASQPALLAAKQKSVPRRLPAGLAHFSFSDNESHLETPDATQSLGRLSGNALFLESGVGPTLPSRGHLPKSRSTLTCSLPPSSHFDLSEGPAERLKGWLLNPLHGSEDKENEPMALSSPHVLRAPRSMSFLRSRTRLSATSRQDTALSAPDAPEELSDAGPRRLQRSQPSTLFRPKHRQCGSSTALPRSLRNSSNGSAALSSVLSSGSGLVSKRTGIRVKARKVSSTLKSKFKGLFRPTSANEATGDMLGLPASSGSESGASYRRIDKTPEPEEASMSRVPSHVPSLHAVPSNQRLRSRQGSLESLRLEQNLSSDDRSRVTSWTDSSANTVASVTSHADWERQRLSVIKENGTHISSRVGPRSTNSPMASGPMPGPLPPGSVIDSQRIYSALMKRLNDRQEACMEPNVDTQLASSRDRRGKEAHPQTRPPPTVRCVQADDDVFQVKVSEQLTDGLPRVDDLHGVQKHASASSVSYQAYPRATAGDGRGLSPQSQPRVAADPMQKTLAHQSSALFTSPTSHLFRTSTPYRRALRESIKEAEEPEVPHALDARYLSTLSALSLPTRRPSTAGSDREACTSDAGSVYSSTTGEVKEGPPENDADADESTCWSLDHDSGAGEEYCPAQIAPPPAHDRNVSTASSVEWKTWLSANVSKLETPSTTMSADSRGDFCHGLPPTFGHVREEAEIDSPSDFPRPQMLRAAMERSGPVRHLMESPCQVSLSAGLRRADVRHEPTPAADENSPPAAAQRHKSRAPPLIPSRSSLRTTPSMLGVHSGVHAERRECRLPRMRSLNTLGPRASPTHEENGQKRLGRSRAGLGSVSPAQSSPGLTAAVEKQFGKTSTGSPRGRCDRRAEDDWLTPKCKTDGGIDGKTASSEWDAQVMGSKRMVDLFLSSRRRRIEGSATGAESDNTSMVFI